MVGFLDHAFLFAHYFAVLWFQFNIHLKMISLNYFFFFRRMTELLKNSSIQFYLPTIDMITTTISNMFQAFEK